MREGDESVWEVLGGVVLVGAAAFFAVYWLGMWAVEDEVRKVEEGRKDWRTMLVLPVPVGRQGAFGVGGFLNFFI